MTKLATENEQDVADPIHPPINSLPDALTFRLARLVAVNYHNGSRVFREAYGISLNEWRVLGLVSATSPVMFGHIRKILLIDKGQLSRIVKRLTDRGVLVARPSKNDARVIELTLSEEGQLLHDQVLRFTAERNEEVVATLTREECSEFIRILRKITVHTNELAGLPE